MKAAIYYEYGESEVLCYEEVALPSCMRDQVLVKVHSTSTNPCDAYFLQGRPFPMRMVSGVKKPIYNGLGQDLSGTVVSVGSDVNEFSPGDEVFGGVDKDFNSPGYGAFAEYVCVSTSAITKKPPNITFAEAGCVSMAGRTALNALKIAAVKSGSSVLITGASGGVGTFALQIAKSLGAEVTCVCSSKNVELIESLGADRVIEYQVQDFTTNRNQFDAMIDIANTKKLSKCLRTVKNGGTYVMVGVPHNNTFLGPLTPFIKASLRSIFPAKVNTETLSTPRNKQDLDQLRALLESETIKPVIGARYSIQELKEAMDLQMGGHSQGKNAVSLLP